jgi:hypothetical protein
MAAGETGNTLPKTAKTSWGILPSSVSPGPFSETVAQGDPLWRKWHWIVYRHDWSTVQFKFAHRTVLVKLEDSPPFNAGLQMGEVLENGKALATASFERLERPNVFAEVFFGYRFRTSLRLHSHGVSTDSLPPDAEMVFARHKVEDCRIEGNDVPIKRSYDSVVEVYDCDSFRTRIQSGSCELRIKRPEHLVHSAFLTALIWRHSSSENPG